MSDCDNVPTAEDDLLFIELRNYIVDDLVNKQAFVQSVDDFEYDDYSDDSYYVLFTHTIEDLCLYLLRIEGHSIQVSAESFDWNDFIVSTKEEWDTCYSPRIALPIHEE